MSIVPKPLTEFPWRILALLLVIAGFGTVVLYSAASGSIFPWAVNQAVRFCIFSGMALALSRIPVEIFARFAFPAYGAVLVALFLVELIGGVAGGSQRWINLGFMQLQPSEFMKPIIVLTVARFYAMLPVGEIRRWNAIWPALVLIGVPFMLVLVQPDLGTATMIAAGGVTVMFLAGLPMRLFVGTGLAGAALVPIAFSFLHDYQKNRVLIFLDPESDPLGAGYHISQSKIAIGSGGIWGKGFLKGSQSHLDYLPEGHTDFVFATMAEEWGLLGGTLLILAFMLLFRWGIRVSMRTQDKFARMAAAGLTTTVFFYVAINLMMVMGLAPVVGIPLPFMSYGGSSMLTVMLCVGIIMAIDRAGKRRAGTGNWR
ncbi:MULTISPECIES: rod shape-determining protein RodA [Sphingobium]|jgi:rod shape determining protein RodA|uniref:Peptidoglycan glycosyltransferase MrdB n=1 Tax=Sphingobium limneticum TaxID=1007511 RepID=A0A5J5I2A9_9SPHN|nr:MULTISPECIES: rod shape-determining protein RodA [Sphingobium]MBU0933837.1 rod shape-determining protein RodA [Alphaproteobacteria bacterium]KAA9016271.1 rod shape-determining protein RodA [Sphingobium limneticum]KAA9018512.1 rod shape-determining protein RodA [Sphingobium limneticum]KAA9028840.1 rod shape-determining protein RodA [Sphingobium limneticum]BBC99740.1 rod shape determining protein RodA [Sphingobium sp. YG1]